MVLARTCGQTKVSQALATLTHRKENTMRQRLREWTWEKDAKAGKQRCELDVTSCFRPLLRWVLRCWPEGECRLALAMDASSLGMTFVVLSISVVYRGCAIPIAWKVLRAAQKGAWKEEWLALFAALCPGLPKGWLVVVLADRGLYADWLFRAIHKHGWHPLLRINLGGHFRPYRAYRFRPLEEVVPRVGSAWTGRVTCFKTNPLRATLLARWDEGYTEPWLILTDLAPEQAQVTWYGLRPWIENGFRDTKQDGWQWQHTRMTDPARATRLWLAIAVATLWVVRVGGEADASLPASSLAALPPTHIAHRLCSGHPSARSLSCFQRGLVIILVALIEHHPLPIGRFVPEPWPS